MEYVNSIQRMKVEVTQTNTTETCQHLLFDDISLRNESAGSGSHVETRKIMGFFLKLNA